jgi:hypothetical protein
MSAGVRRPAGRRGPAHSVRLLGITGVTLCVGGMVACGGPSPQLVRDDFASQVIAVCQATGNPSLNGRPTEPQAFLNSLVAQVPAQAEGLRALRKLQPPAAESRAWSSQLLDSEQRALDDVRTAVTPLRAAISSKEPGQAAAVVRQTLDRLNADHATVTRYWTEHAMTDCNGSLL